MAGKPGRSGGARPGAGRKPKPPPEPVRVTTTAGSDAPAADAEPVEDMLDLLQKVALGRVAATPLQVRAAIAAVQYTHTKRGDGGKREEEAERARRAGSGRFAAAAPPPLKLVGGA